MRKGAKATIDVKGTAIAVRSEEGGDRHQPHRYRRSKNPDQSDDLIRNWIRSRTTLEFLGTWEILNNPSFNPVEFDGIRMQAGLNTFALTPKQWIERTAAIGIVSRPGRYGGTFAHSDIAFEFATWVSVEFKLYLIKEFQRLKAEESQRLADGWDPEAVTCEDQLPNPHRCNQESPDTSDDRCTGSGDHICQ
ncbi:MAG: KilA-N domain-containing protein [Thermomicrobiales bacterium]